MVPSEFASFFATSAQAAAALVGLLFVAVSLAPEQTIKRSAPVERQAVAGSTFTALLNALFISMAALVPRVNFGAAVLAVGVASLLSTLALSRALLHQWTGWARLCRRLLLLGGSLALYSIELKEGLILVRNGADAGAISVLAQLLLPMYGLAVLRAWQLLGAETFGLHAWLNVLHGLEERQRELAADEVAASNREGDRPS